MANISAKRYVCAVCGAEYIVTRPGEGEVVCCGKPMTLKTEETPAKDTREGENKSIKGLRYTCETCKTQVLCIKEAPMAPACCGHTMTKQTFFINAASE